MIPSGVCYNDKINEQKNKQNNIATAKIKPCKNIRTRHLAKCKSKRMNCARTHDKYKSHKNEIKYVKISMHRI